MAIPDSGPVAEPPKQESAWKDLVERGRLLLFLGVLLVELLIFFGAMVVPIDPATQQRLQQAANSLQNSTVDQPPASMMTLIFSNNVKVGLAEMVPGVGPIVFFISILNTGEVIQVLGLMRGAPGILYGLVLFVFPYSLVELSGYAVAVGSGLMLLIAWRRKRLRQEARVFVLEAVGVVLILLLAAAMETTTLLLPAVGLALWLPMGLLVAWTAIRLRKARG
jgi:uncharacterized membrane protein SpoIIM required for sporulation